MRLIILGLLWTNTLYADPVRYRLDTDKSVVEFIYRFQGVEQKGRMPVLSAIPLIDLQNIRGSSVQVTLAANQLTTGVFFITDTLKGADFLETQNHPTLSFRSTSVTGRFSNATLKGILNIKGQDYPVTLRGGLYRQRNAQEGENVFLLETTLDRRDYGLTAYPNLVGHQIGIRIIAAVYR